MLFFSARGIAAFYTDWLWFRSLGYSQVFTGVIGARVALAVIFTVVFTIILWINLLVAERTAPAFRPAGPEDAFIERYQQLVARRVGLVRLGIALLFGLIAGVGTSGEWRSWLLFTHYVKFGVKDAQFNTDVGFYVFRLPFLSFIVGWLFTSIVIILVVTAVSHYLNGGIRLQVQGQRVTPQVKAHLSVLLVALALLRAVGYYLERYQLALSTRGLVDGAGYTDVKAELPALNLLILISLLAGALLVWNIFRKGWVLPGIAVGLWGLVAVVAGAIYPAAIQKVQVDSQSSREIPYLARNIVATKNAYGLDALTTNNIELEPKADAATAAAEPNIKNTLLLDPTSMTEAFQSAQSLLGFYRVGSLDFDRYTVGDTTTQVVVGARELNQDAIPNPTWENTHLAYTHGYGLVVAPANKVVDRSNGGEPDYSAFDLKITQPEIYFGEEMRGYAVADTAIDEISLAGSSSEVAVNQQAGTAATRYGGEGGVKVGGFFRRVAYALRFWDRNILFSGKINENSRVLYIRNVEERVKTLAPFLDFDANPYPVVVDGRIKWVIDAYTTTDKYPYSQRAEPSAVSGASGLSHPFNYVRNSIKAVIDAYDGDVKFYVVDSSDPLARSYQKAFPKLFTNGSAAPAELVAHYRYPTDLFKQQTDKWGRYRFDDAKAFLEAQGAWQVASEPGREQQTASVSANTPVSTVAGISASTTAQRFEPYYQLLRLPNSTDVQYTIVRPFVPKSTGDTARRLAGFMTSSTAVDGTSKVNVFAMNPSNLPQEPSLVAQVQQTQFSAQFTLLDQQGSKVEFGPMQLVPVGKSIAFVRAQYVHASAPGSPNVLDNVVATAAETPYLVPDINTLVSQVYNGTVPTPSTGGTSGGGSSGGSGGTPSTDAGKAVTDAAKLLKEADDALRAGDLATYQAKVNQARKVLEAAGVTVTTTVPSSSNSGSTAASTTAAPTTIARTTVAGATTTAKPGSA